MEMETQLEHEMLLLEKTNATLFQALTERPSGAPEIMSSRGRTQRHHAMNRLYDRSKDRKVKLLKKEVAELEQQKVDLLGKVGEKQKQKAIRHRSEAAHLRRKRDLLHHRIHCLSLESKIRRAIINWRGKSVKNRFLVPGQTRATMLSVLDADTEATVAPRNSALLPFSILERKNLKANLKAWHRWKILALSDRTNNFVPEHAASTLSRRALWYADRDLTNHHLKRLARNLMRWKARIIMKHWSLNVRRICKIQEPIVHATNQQRQQKGISVAFNLRDPSVQDSKRLQNIVISIRQELALRRLSFALRLRDIRLLSIYLSKWQNALHSLQIESLKEANSGKKQSIKQELKARAIETLFHVLANKNALRMARGLRMFQKVVQSSMLDYEKVLRGSERIKDQFALAEITAIRKAWKKWTDINQRQIILERSLQPFLVASRLAALNSSCHQHNSFRMGDGQAITRSYSSSFLMSFMNPDEEHRERVAKAFYFWAELSRELSRRGRALFVILSRLHKLNLNHVMQEWRRAIRINGREKENRNTILLEAYNRDHLRLRSCVLRNLVRHKCFVEQQYSVFWAWKCWMVNMLLQSRNEREIAKIGLVMNNVKGIAYRLQLTAAFMKWKRNNTNMNRVRSGLQLTFSIVLRAFLHREYRAFSMWRKASSSAASKHSEALLMHEKSKRGAVMVYTLLSRFQLSMMHRLWMAWKHVNMECFKLEIGAVLARAGSRLVISILKRSVVMKAKRLFKLWSDHARHHVMYYQDIEHGGTLLFAVLTRKLYSTHRQRRRFLKWKEYTKRLVDGERWQGIQARSMVQTLHHTICRTQTRHLSCAWSHWKGLCAAATRNQIALESLCIQKIVVLRNVCRIYTQQKLKHLGMAWNFWQQLTQYNAWLEASTLEGVYYVASVIQRITIRSNRTHLARAWQIWRKLSTVGIRHHLEEQSVVVMSKGKAVISAFLIKKALSSLNRRSLGRHFHCWLGQSRRLTLAHSAIKALQRLMKVKIMNAACKQWRRATDFNAFNSSVQAMRLASSLIIVHEKCTNAVGSLHAAFQLWRSAIACVRAADLRLSLATNIVCRLSDRLHKHRIRDAFDSWVDMSKRSTYFEMQSISGSFFMANTIRRILSRIRRRSLARAMQTLGNHCDVSKSSSSAAALLCSELKDVKRNSAALMVIGMNLIRGRMLRLGIALRFWQHNTLLYSSNNITSRGTVSMSQASSSPCISTSEKRRAFRQHVSVRGSHTLAALSVYRVRRRRLLCLALFAWKWCSHSETDLSRRIGRDLALAMSVVKEDWPLPLQHIFRYSRRHYYHAIDSVMSRWQRAIFLDKEYVDTSSFRKSMDHVSPVGQGYPRGEEVKSGGNYSDDDGAMVSPLSGNAVVRGAGDKMKIYQQVPSRHHLQLSPSTNYDHMTERLRGAGEEGSRKTVRWEELVVREKETPPHQELQQHYEYQHSPAVTPLQRPNVAMAGSNADEVEFHRAMAAATSRVRLLKRQQSLRIVVIASLKRQSYDWHISSLSSCFRKWKERSA